MDVVHCIVLQEEKEPSIHQFLCLFHLSPPYLLFVFQYIFNGLILTIE